MKNILCLLAAMFCLTRFATAATYAWEDETCPLCKTQFKAEVALSGSVADLGLDFKPLGFMPAPWPVPVCPYCKFVLYGKEIPKDELQKCQRIVSSAAYKKHSDRSSHYLLEALGKIKRETNRAP